MTVERCMLKLSLPQRTADSLAPQRLHRTCSTEHVIVMIVQFVLAAPTARYMVVDLRIVKRAQIPYSGRTAAAPTRRGVKCCSVMTAMPQAAAAVRCFAMTY